ncbi:hypothetical protein NHL51_10840 [Leucobacter sp. gxy201]|uniref:hypothetical protein n=1 Tax=Leucobacter sp. gxy201 TaxID=2957200 RepID=UPI003DA19AB8
MGAFSLWEHIDGIVRGWYNEFYLSTRGTLLNLLQRLPGVVQAEHANGTIDDDLRERLDAMYALWVQQIEDLFDPPHQKELTAPCPSCGERWHVEDDTQRAAAVVIPVKRGRAVIAECRCCGAMWASEAELVALAIGMDVQVDFVALRKLAAGAS